ncbi:MAG TPA: hypothetical protein VG371_14420 [Solirubrobacteraceae bacterium]|jgi:hypothetical protein|nr:hypothetical protein [Solirubrobacteraceae bacterium]
MTSLPRESNSPPSARADSGDQLTVNDCLVSARADAVACALEEVRQARREYDDACREQNRALASLDARIYDAGRAGASVRKVAAAAGLGKTLVHNIMRYADRSWA